MSRLDLTAMARRLRDVALFAPTERFELSVGFLGLLWGLILLNPWARAFATTPTFGPMAALAPEEAWGAGAFATGCLSLVALGQDWRRLRRWACALHGLAWTFIAAMLGIGNPLGTGWAVYGLFAVLSWLVFLRLGPRPRRG